jgi:nucleoid DNA-binding protein
VTFAELVATVAEESGLPKTTVARTLRSFIALTRKALASGDGVRLHGFGAFYTIFPRPGPMFGGRRSATGRRIVRFKETRRGILKQVADRMGAERSMQEVREKKSTR